MYKAFYNQSVFITYESCIAYRVQVLVTSTAIILARVAGHERGEVGSNKPITRGESASMSISGKFVLETTKLEL